MTGSMRLNTVTEVNSPVTGSTQPNSLSTYVIVSRRSLALTMVRTSEMLRTGSLMLCWQFSGTRVIVPMPRSMARS